MVVMISMLKPKWPSVADRFMKKVINNIEH